MQIFESLIKCVDRHAFVVSHLPGTFMILHGTERKLLFMDHEIQFISR